MAKDFVFQTAIDFGGAEQQIQELRSLVNALAKDLKDGLSFKVDGGAGAAGLQKTGAALDKNRTKADQYTAAQKRAEAATVDAGTKGSAAYAKQEKAIEQATTEVKQYDAAMDRASKSTASLGGGGQKLGGLDNALGKVSGKIGALTGAVPALGGLSSGLSSVAAVGGPAALAVGGLAVAGVALKKVVDIGGAFQDQVADMRSIIGATAEEADQLGKRARQLGKDWGIEATQGVETFKLTISALGPEVAKDQDALQSMGNTILQFAKAGGVDGATATDALTVTLSQFGFASLDAAKKAEKMAEISNVLAAAAQEGSAEIPDLSASMRVAGATAKNAGLSVEQTAAALEQLAPAGIKGAEAGTAVRNVLLKMSAGTKQGADALAEMGLTFSDINPKAVGFEQGLKNLRDGFEKIQDPVKKANALKRLFGLENANAAQLLLKSADGLEAFTEKITGTSVAQEQAAIKMDTFNAKMGKLKVGLEDVAIQIFDALEPALSVTVDVLIQVANVLGPVLTAVGEAISFIYELTKATVEAVVGWGEWLVNLKPVQAVLTAISTAAKNTWNAIKGLGQAVAGGAVRAWKDFVVSVRYVWAILGQKLYPILQSIGNFFRGVWNGIIGLVVKWWKIKVNAVKTVWNWLKTLGTSVLTLGGRFNGIINILKDVGRWISWLVGKIGGVVKKIAEFLGLLGSSSDDAGGGSGGGGKSAWASRIGSAMGDVGDAAAQAQTQAAEIGEDIGGAMGDGMSSGAEKAAAVVKNEVLDFIEVVRSALESARAARFDLFVGSLTDEEDIIRANGTERRRAIEAEYDNELRSIDEKLAEAEKKKKDAAANKETLNIEIKNLTEARQALAEKRSALIDQQLTDEQKQVRENRLKLLDTELKADEEAFNAIMANRKGLRDTEIKLLDDDTVDGVTRATALKLEGLVQEYQETARKIAATSPEYQNALARIEEQVASGSITAFEGTIQANEALNRITLEQQKKTGTRINAEYRLMLAEQERLKKDSEDRKKDIELDALKNGSVAFRLALALREIDYSKHFDKLIDIKKKAADKEKEIDDRLLESLRDKLRRGVINRSQFLDELRGLQESSKTAAEENYTFWDATFGALKEGMTAFAASSREIFTQQAAEINKVTQDTTTTVGDVWRATGSLVAPAVEEMTGQIIGLAASTTNTLKDFAKQSLIIALDALKRVAVIAAAEILAKSFAANPILGAILAAGATAAISLAVSAAQAAVASFRTGGYTGRGGVNEPAGVVHRREFVHTAEKTKRFRPLFEAIHRGAHPFDAAMRLYGERARRLSQLEVKVERSKSGVMIDSGLLQAVRSMEAAAERASAEHAMTRKAVEKMQKELYTRQHVEVSGDIHLSGSDLEGSLQSTKRNRLKGRR